MQITRYSKRGPEPAASIEMFELNTPKLAPGEVLLEVLAAPINPSDVLTLTGEYGMLPPLPAIGGNEGVGRVALLGAGVDSLQIGQLVLLPVGSGTWVSHILAKAAKLIALPQADPLQLAMISINPPTASLLLSEFEDLQPGDWVIQNAANSAVGGYLIQLARGRGIKTINIVRRAELIEPLKRQGADLVLLDQPKLHRAMTAEIGDNRVKLGIDAIGGEATDHLAACISEGGTLVNYGMMSGQPCQVSAASFVFRDLTLKGFWLARWFDQATPQQQAQMFANIVQRIVSGELYAPIHATYSLAQIKQAVAVASSGARNGKVLLVPEHR